MQKVCSPTSASSSVWTSTGNAIVKDSNYSELTAGASNDWLRLYSFDNTSTLPTNIEIVGFQVDVFVENSGLVIAPPLGSYERLEVALSLDGMTASPGTVLMPYVIGTGAVTFGGVSELFGRAWTVNQIKTGNFSVLIRRGDVLGNEYTGSPRRVDSVVMTVFYNYSGGSIAMVDRIQGLQRFTVAQESTPGTFVTPTTRMKAAVLEMTPKVDYKDISHYGQLTPGDRVKAYEWAEGNLVGAPDFNELHWFFNCLFGAEVKTTIATGVIQREWTIDPRSKTNFITMSQEIGSPDEAICERFNHVLLQTFGLSPTKKDSAISGTAMAKVMVDQAAIPAGGVNAVQTLTITATGGSFVLGFKGARTTSINVSGLSGSALQTALLALTSIGVGNVTVTGSGPYVITFTGTLAGREQPTIDIVSSAATGGTVTIASTTKGGWTEYVSAPLVGGNASLYYASTLAGLTAGKLTDLRKLDFQITDRFDPDDVMTDDELSFRTAIEKPYNINTMISVKADAAGQTLAADARSASGRYHRFRTTSAQDVATGYKYQLDIDLFGKLKDAGAIKAMGQVRVRDFTFETLYDETWGKSGAIRLVSAVP
jgi:hypothetical protein